MRRWQFDVLFVVAVVGLFAMLFIEEPPPAVVTGLTAVLTFVLAQRPDWTRDNGGEHKSGVSDKADDDA